MLDTENKRRSIMGIKPVPDLNIDKSDRLQFMDWFSAIAPIFNPFFFWRKHNLNQTDWGQGSNLVGIFIPVIMAGNVGWITGEGNPDAFIPDKKAPPKDWVPVLDFPEDQ